MVRSCYTLIRAANEKKFHLWAMLKAFVVSLIVLFCSMMTGASAAQGKEPLTASHSISNSQSAIIKFKKSVPQDLDLDKNQLFAAFPAFYELLKNSTLPDVEFNHVFNSAETATEDVSGLSRIIRMTVDSPIEIRALCSAIMSTQEVEYCEPNYKVDVVTRSRN